MPIINLKIEGKKAIGDGTKIVCLNNDYVVHITVQDNDEWISLPVKKLVVKYDREYSETDITESTTDGQTIYKAILPPIDSKEQVHIGVCGKNSDDPDAEPIITTTPAAFLCDMSVLSGAAVLIKEPDLIYMDINENGLYKAMDHRADGFYEVKVNVASAPRETPTVPLSMAEGNQIIVPSVEGRVISYATVTKPTTLVPENILEGVDIGGVVGTHSDKLTEQTVYRDGEYTPPEGFSGFSKITVKVGKSSFDKVLRVGDTFTHNYDESVEVNVDRWGIVRYENTGEAIIFTASDMGSCFVTVDNLDADGNVVDTTYYAITVNAEGDSSLPVEASNVEEMNAFLARGIAGSIVKYTGENAEGFVQNALYIVEEVE